MSDEQPQGLIPVKITAVETARKAEQRRRNTQACSRYRASRQTEWKRIANEAHSTYANPALDSEWQKAQNHLIRAATDAAEKSQAGVASVQATLEPWFRKISEDVQEAALAGGWSPEKFRKEYRDQHGWKTPSWNGPRGEVRDTASASAQPQYWPPSGLTSAARNRPGHSSVEAWPLPPSRGEPGMDAGQLPQAPHAQLDMPFGGTLPLPVPSQNAGPQGWEGAPLPRLHDYMPTGVPSLPPVRPGTALPSVRPDLPFNGVLPPLVRDAAAPGNRPYSPPPGLRQPGGPAQGRPQGR